MATSYQPSHPSTQPTGYPKPTHFPSFIERACLGLTEKKTSDVKGIKVRYIMNFFKATTALFIISLMNHYKNYSLGSCLYLALHGIYGMIWLLKDFGFPDRNFDRRVGIFGALTHIFVLAGYWILPWIQMSGHGVDKPSSERVMSCVILFTVGIALMVAADAQKTFTLRHEPVLISDGMFKYTRNPNYLGQMLIHSSFALATGSVVGWGVVLTLWTVFFVPRMIAKDASLRDKPGADEYFARSSILLPKLFFKNKFLHYFSWIMIIGAIISLGGMVSFTHMLKKFHPLKYLAHKLR